MHFKKYDGYIIRVHSACDLNPLTDLLYKDSNHRVFSNYFGKIIHQKHEITEYSLFNLCSFEDKKNNR